MSLKEYSVTPNEISILADAFSLFAQNAEAEKLEEFVRNIVDSIEANQGTESNHRKGHEILLEWIAERSRESDPTGGKTHPLTTEALAQRALEAERKREAEFSKGKTYALRAEELAAKAWEAERRHEYRVDLPKDTLYGKSKLLHDKLKIPHEGQGHQELLERASALETKNLELQVEITRLRDQLAVASREAVGDPGAVESVVAEMREGIEEIPEVDLSQVPLFVGGRGSDPMAHLREHYGQWLAYFGASRNSVWLHQVRRHDPKFVRALTDRVPKIEEIAALGDIIPTKMEMRDELLHGKTFEEIAKNEALARVAYARLQVLLYR